MIIECVSKELTDKLMKVLDSIDALDAPPLSKGAAIGSVSELSVFLDQHTTKEDD